MNSSIPSGWSPDDLETPVLCPACGSVLSGCAYHSLQDWLERTPGSWQLRSCPSCASLALAPRPTFAAIGKAYASYYTHAQGDVSSMSENDSSPLWKLANGYMNARYGSRRKQAWLAGRWLMPALWPLCQQLDYFYRHLPRQAGRLLDVGCGNGAFLVRARAAGWRVAGIEPDLCAAEAGRQNGLDMHVGTLDDFHSVSVFDVVTASHVIEHVHEPKRFLEQIAKLLCADGMLWLATPNVASMGHHHYGRAWRGLEPPRHMTIFSRRALQQLLERSGFTDIRFHRRGRGARYILRTSDTLAQAEAMRVRPLPAWQVDICASLSANAGEELVVTARKAS